MSPLNGGAERVRTDDLLNANQPLFQLSYGPIYSAASSPALRLYTSQRTFALRKLLSTIVRTCQKFFWQTTLKKVQRIVMEMTSLKTER